MRGRLSKTRTVSPCFKSVSAIWEPMKPAPPVTSVLLPYTFFYARRKRRTFPFILISFLYNRISIDNVTDQNLRANSSHSSYLCYTKPRLLSLITILRVILRLGRYYCVYAFSWNNLYLSYCSTTFFFALVTGCGSDSSNTSIAIRTLHLPHTLPPFKGAVTPICNRCAMRRFGTVPGGTEFDH